MRIEDYLENGRVKRGSISQHIKLKKISRSELDILINDQRINKGFVGDRFQNKKPRAEWNQEYLDLLVYEAVAGTFNADYLRYLFEVAQYVNPQTSDDSASAGTNKGIKKSLKKGAKKALNRVRKGADVVKDVLGHR